jgi:hypothetical protein
MILTGGKKNIEYCWNDTDRGETIWSIVGMILTGGEQKHLVEK